MNFLIVDDSIDSLNLLGNMLSKEGKVTCANNGEEAIHCFKEAHTKEKQFHLIFLDIIMPEMDGHKVLKRIRELEATEFFDKIKAKIAMATSVTSTKSRFSAFREGCDYFISKPFIKNEILEIVHNTKEWFFDELGS